MERDKSIDHLFLHCPLTLRLWHRVFKLAHLDWVPPRGICDMMIISYKELGRSIIGQVLWETTCLALMWIVGRETLGVFRTKQELQRLFRISSISLASFEPLVPQLSRIYPLNVIRLGWMSVCGSKGVLAKLARSDWYLYIPIWVVAPYNCIDLLSTSEVHTFCVVFLRGFRILLLYILLLILIYSIIVSHKNK